MNSHQSGSDDNRRWKAAEGGHAYEPRPGQATYTSLESLMQDPEPVREAPRKALPKTDLASLVGEDRAATFAFTEHRGWTDILIDVLTPVMIFVMCCAIGFFLLDVRYVVTAVLDLPMRIVMFCFLLGIVALNRLIAREGQQESIIYAIGLAGAISLYTFSAQVYDVGSYAGPLFTLTPEIATGFNFILVCFIWWLVNRLTHECCVDENRVAGEIGMLTGTGRRFQEMYRRAKNEQPVEKPKRKKKDDAEFKGMYVLQAFDPTEGYKAPEKPKADLLQTSERLSGHHPGMSIFYFSVPVMLIFALGLRLIQHGGPAWVRTGMVYMAVYTFTALSLLMLTSLGQLREYFRRRKVILPGGLGFFWVGLGTFMVLAVMVLASLMPMPSLPPIAHVAEHVMDPYVRDNFRPLEVQRDEEAVFEDSLLVHRLRMIVLVVLGIFAVFGGLRGLVLLATMMRTKGHQYHRWVRKSVLGLGWMAERLTRIPRLPERGPRVRIQPDIATCRDFTNSMGNPELAQRMTVNNHVEYAYQALGALAYDLGVPRRMDETPYEFLARLPRVLNPLRAEAEELTQLYVMAAYTNLPMDEKVLDRLRKFWMSYERSRRRIVR